MAELLSHESRRALFCLEDDFRETADGNRGNKMTIGHFREGSCRFKRER